MSINLRELASVKISSTKTVVESVASNTATSTDGGTLITEDDNLIQPPSIPGDSKLLAECYDSPSYAGYTERTLEEKLRDAVSQIKYALESEAYKGMGDDGKVRKPYAQGEPDAWSVTEKLLAKQINVNMFKDMLPAVKTAISKFYE